MFNFFWFASSRLGNDFKIFKSYGIFENNMNQKIENKIKFKIFIGCVISAELRMHLHQSALWKLAKIGPQDQKKLNETHFNQKDYIGFFLAQDRINLPELKVWESKILEELKAYCPHFPSEKIKVLVFSQVFIS